MASSSASPAPDPRIQESKVAQRHVSATRSSRRKGKKRDTDARERRRIHCRSLQMKSPYGSFYSTGVTCTTRGLGKSYTFLSLRLLKSSSTAHEPAVPDTHHPSAAPFSFCIGHTLRVTAASYPDHAFPTPELPQQVISQHAWPSQRLLSSFAAGSP